ncbi:MAG: ATP synthase F0 subunit C [Coriobacteriia bacterium]|nr:ATP synthase F0 subunit C [Coriobacteriia bacterium]MCL2537056.1 ATP synthase F0 subunit C [Coriobacteriia bacterium]
MEVLAMFAYPLAVIGAATCISLLGQVAAKSIARQPEAGGTIQTIFILGAAFIEVLCLLAFVLSLMA